jgi:hypothetical protein
MKKMNILCFTFLALLLATAYAGESNDIKYPELQLLKMDSMSYLQNADLNDNYNTVFINFSPACDHCRNTIQSILSNLSKFSETQFVLTSYEEFASIRKFYFENFLDGYKHIHIGQETDFSLTRQIHYASFPSLVIFDKHKTWIKTINGESNAKSLLKILKIKSD